MLTDLRIYNHKEATATCPSNGSERLGYYVKLPLLFEGAKLQLHGVPGFGGVSAFDVIDVVITFHQGDLMQIVTCKPGCLANPDAPYWARTDGAPNVQAPPPPKIRIKCETSLNIPGLPSAGGITSLPVDRVEPEDDGSFTVVTSFWPKADTEFDYSAELERMERIACDTKKGFAYDRHLNQWWWYGQSDFEERGVEAYNGGFSTRVEALQDAIEPYLNPEDE